ncbi:CLOCK-interacting pacemaker a [Lepisosteus oculatus]|uniref:CLOCK-interacting pacemaker a n=1 Tax=Lepisosteus oculatus TaxID=7918 RepID=W5MYZ5_LEPOC|nr:PREDICTED: CLOCK-interacting pacemaker [Lepisosteus oculatus]XP_015205885.1 PREDICTED: CLOCK-interacting pacemaker [Lepisosteus oculatus]XP_015205886.1 PREDICTED: CLOCK-interacting pacemaker [Lepisosteus oculatus]XP_015205887.1 PREDICTED: CLOCK-interacting pacemaker [Lepisosteus oculatus]XP_015205888.1 PREDICTED: CLOCK-interacting pacemaker [Lepisosteus oculatus]XP_015205889.1 PREDICTED: CLOCK-interacting pacemaker [Lepisosteus oculatus]XP_015205890.1 PREDICTED: CLOCK-interacting pacemaker
MSNRGKAESHRRLSAGLHADMMDTLKNLQPDKGRNESERDSGFSDASSEYLSAVEQTDAEDGQKTSAQSIKSKSQLPQLAVMGGGYPGLSPMIIMNNVLLKQASNCPPAVKPWGFQPAIEVIPQPQVVFLQPVISNGITNTQKGPQDKRRRSQKYLPILKSYPKIAPHPGESSSERSASGSSERSGSASARVDRASALRHRRHSREKQLSRLSSTASPTPSGLPLPLTPEPSTRKHHSSLSKTESASSGGQPTPPASSQEAPPPARSPGLAPVPPAAASPSRTDPDPDPEEKGSVLEKRNKRKRFCNTYNILHKSGLLGITLRTKELIRQNRKTQSELDRLKAHADLFVEAIRSGDPQVWTKLQLAMLECEPSMAEDGGEKEIQTLP